MSSARDAMMQCSRLAFQVKRYHTWPVIQVQTIADHVGNLLRLYTIIFGAPSPIVTEYFVWHDAGEFKTGDAPFPVKARNPIFKAESDRIEQEFLTEMGVTLPKLDAHEKLKCKVIDLLEMLELGLMERALGNTMAQPIIDDTTAAVLSLLPQLRFHNQEDDEHVRRYVLRVKSQFRSFGSSHARDSL